LNTSEWDSAWFGVWTLLCIRGKLDQTVIITFNKMLVPAL
jgi:hypothetical protein